MTSSDEAVPSGEAQPVVVKKYANRRLYNTESSSYITLDNLADMVRLGRDFVVYDARTGEDITRGVLTQIIVEEESKVGRAMLPIPFLRQLIGFYGDSLQGVVPGYLEQSMAAFARQQQQLREAVQQTMGSFLPPGFEQMGRQNMAMLERAMTLFTPFYRHPGAAAAPEPVTEPGDETASLRAEIERLRSELALRPPVPAKEALPVVAPAAVPAASDAAPEEPAPDLGSPALAAFGKPGRPRRNGT